MRSMSKLAPVLLAALCAWCFSACGKGGASSGAHRPASQAPESIAAASATSPGGHDVDDDDKSPTYDDTNNYLVTRSGSAAEPATRHAVSALLKRYYAAAAAEDGASACSMILARLAAAVPEDYGRPPGALYLRGGKTCTAVMDKLFVHDHRLLASEARKLEVLAVRLHAQRGIVVLRFGTPLQRQISVQRERDGSWSVGTLLDSELP